MSKYTILSFVFFHLYVAGFLALGVYFAGTQPTLIALLLALGIVLNLGLIGVFMWDVHEQHVSEQEKIIWSLLFIFLWPSMWVYCGLFGLGWRGGKQA